MKNIFLFSSFLILFVTCKKDNTDEDVVPYFGTVTVNKNGQIWNAKIGAGSTPQFGNFIAIGLDNFNSYGFRRGHLSIYKIPWEVGKFEIKRTTSALNDGITGSNYFAYIDDGDLSAGTWLISETDSLSSWVEINDLDTSTGEVTGTFHLEFLIDSTRIDSRFYESGEPSRITFSNGTFYTKIAEIK